MQRRKFLTAMGSLAAGGAAAMGTGAFSDVQAQRGLNVEVKGDANAYLQLTASNDLENGEYATGPNEGDTNQLSLNFNGDADTEGGAGVNVDAMNRFDEVFEVANMGTQTVNLFIKDQGNGATLSDDQANRIRFYYGDDRKTLEDGGPDDDAKGESKTSLELGQGKSKSIGVEIDTTGLSSEDIGTLVDGTIIIYASE